jgi:hypothetical protein
MDFWDDFTSMAQDFPDTAGTSPSAVNLYLPRAVAEDQSLPWNSPEKNLSVTPHALGEKCQLLCRQSRILKDPASFPGAGKKTYDGGMRTVPSHYSREEFGFEGTFHHHPNFY